MIRKAAMLCVAMLLGVAFAVPFLKLRDPIDPIHRGKAVSSWIDELTSSDYRVRDGAEDALRAVGPEAIPQLIRGLHRSGTRMRASGRARPKCSTISARPRGKLYRDSLRGWATQTHGFAARRRRRSAQSAARTSRP